MPIYTDYIQINRDFIPVFSKEADADKPESWKSFIPHQPFRVILEKLIQSLDRGQPADKRSLWLQGAYGTGKTYAVFVLKHLLEDPLAEVEAYCQNSDVLRGLWPRLKALRERGDYLVAFTSSAQHITSSLRLFLEVQRTIKQRLRERFPDAPVAPALLDALLAKIGDPDSSFDWSKAFERHRGLFLQEASAQAVIEKLREENLELAARVNDVLEKEGVVVTGNAQDLKRWIEETINQSKLAGIVLIWDEFTDFFSRNDQVSDLQELAQATANMPFYLFLVTHRDLEQYRRIDDMTRKKIGERFHLLRFGMQSITAYHLLGHAMVATPGAPSDWEVRLDALWARVGKATEALLGDEVRKEDFRKLLPLHPFAAFLLARISAQFSSSQRTLFRFLKDDASPNSFAFFLTDHPRDGWDLLTADRLWDYFFQDEDSEVAEATRDVAGYCRSRLDAIESPDARRVFKSVMLLEALSRQSQGDHILRPCKINVQKLFHGSPLGERIPALLQGLCDGGMLNATPFKEGNDQYVIPLQQISREKLDELKRQQPTFTALVSTLDASSLLRNLFKPIEQTAQVRFHLISTSAEGLGTSRERVAPEELAPYKLGIVLVATLTEEQLPEAERLCVELSQRLENIAFVLLREGLSERRYADWKEHKARAEYSATRQDDQNATYHKKIAERALEEWMTLLQHSRNTRYFQGKAVDLVDMTGYQRDLGELVQQVFPCGPETINRSGTLYNTAGWGVIAAEVGLGITKTVTNQFRPLHNALVSFERQDGFGKDPDHALSRLRKDIAALFVQEAVRLGDIWRQVQAPPYGLSPTAVCATILGFLLKPYAQGYYLFDGANCNALNPNKLAELIKKTLREERGFEQNEIRKVAPEFESLCRLVAEIFRLPAERAAYPDEARKTLRERITGSGFPLFVFNYAGGPLDQRPQSLAGLQEWVRQTDSVALSRQSAGSLASDLESDRKELLSLCDPANSAGSLGMESFILQAAPELWRLADQLGISVLALMRMIRERQRQEVWLWQEDDLRRTLPEVQAELALLDALNQLCGTRKQQLAESVDHCSREWLRQLTRLPLPMLCEETPHPVACKLVRLLDAAPSDRIRLLSTDEVQQLKDERETIRLALSRTKEILRSWLDKYLPEALRALDDEGLDDICGLLSQEFGQLRDIQVINSTLGKIVADQAKSSKILQIKAIWREITGTESASAWSEANYMPLQWVLQSVNFGKLVDVLNQPERYKDAILQTVLNHLDNHRVNLAVILNDQRLIGERFLDTVAGDYKALFSEDGMASRLRSHLHQKLDHPSGWPSLPVKVQEIITAWVKEHYQQNFSQQVVARIEQMSLNQSKELLMKLAEDPMVGARLCEQHTIIEDKA